MRLLSVSLVTNIEWISEDACFSFHPLIAEWFKLLIYSKARAEYTEEAIAVVRAFIDNGDKVEMPIRYKGGTLSHMDKIIEHGQIYAATGRKHVSYALKEASISFGSFYRRVGRYHETQNLIKRAVGDEGVSPAVRNVLANMYCDRGELEKAEKLYNEILAGLKNDHPIRIQTISCKVRILHLSTGLRMISYVRVGLLMKEPTKANFINSTRGLVCHYFLLRVVVSRLQFSMDNGRSP